MRMSQISMGGIHVKDIFSGNFYLISDDGCSYKPTKSVTNPDTLELEIRCKNIDDPTDQIVVEASSLETGKSGYRALTPRQFKLKDL